MPKEYKYHVNLAERLKGIVPEESTCLDLGCGSYSSEVAEQVLSMPWKSLTSVDGYQPDLDVAQAKPSSASEHTFILNDVRNVAGEYDVVLSFDVLEHLPKDDGLLWLSKLEDVAKKRIVLFLPIEPEGFFRTDPSEETNHLQKHLSRWAPHELRSMGYEIEEITDMHSQKVGDSYIHFGAMWAVKNKV